MGAHSNIIIYALLVLLPFYFDMHGSFILLLIV